MWPTSVNNTVIQDINALRARGMEGSACATGRPAFINLVAEGRNDPITLFKQQPHQTANAKELVYHEAQKNLPADFLQAQLSPEGNRIRTLIGVIYQAVKESGNAQDIARLDKVCKKLVEANGNEAKEQKVAKDVSGLVSNYGPNAFETVINKYIEHCMDAWNMHHQTRSVDIRDKAIFKQCLDVCKSTLKHDVEGLTQPNQPWETMAQKLSFFVNDCAAISKTLTFYEADPVAAPPAGPDPLNLRPDDAPGQQRVFIPTGPGQGGITLNITNKAGGVGDITHTVGAANSGPADSNAAIVKHILDSGLSNVEKIGLIKDLFQPPSGTFLNNLVSVQGVRPELPVDPQQGNVSWQDRSTQTLTPTVRSVGVQAGERTVTDVVDRGAGTDELPPPTLALDTQTTAVDGETSPRQTTIKEEDSDLEPVVLREKKEPSAREPLSNDKYIDTTSRSFDLFNRRGSTPTHFVPSEPSVESGLRRAGAKEVTLADKFEALKHRDPAVFDRLDKRGADLSPKEADRAPAEGKVEGSTDHRLQRAEGDIPLTLASDTQTTAVDGETSPRQTTIKEEDSALEAVVLREKKEPSAREPLSNDKYIDTTSRSFDLFNRRGSTPTHFVPSEPSVESGLRRAGAKGVTLADKFEALKHRDPAVFDRLDKRGADLSPKEADRTPAEGKVEGSTDHRLQRAEGDIPLTLAADTQTTEVDGETSPRQTTIKEEDSDLEPVVLREKKEPSAREPLSNDKYIDTTSRSFDPLNRRGSTPTHFVPSEPSVESGLRRAGTKGVTLADKFEALKHRDPAVFDRLDKRGADLSPKEVDRTPAEGKVEGSTDHRLQRAEGDIPQSTQPQGKRADATSPAPGSEPIASETDTVDSSARRGDEGQVKRKAATGGFQPARFNVEAGETSGSKSPDNQVYTTVRTVDTWKREPKPMSFVPTGSESDAAELKKAFSRLGQRDQSAFAAFDQKKAVAPAEPLPFQTILNEFRSRRE